MKQLFRRIFVWILASCARSVLQKFKPFVIGVTGSVGKTSCRMIISSVLQKILPQESINTSQKNYNSEIGLSLSILLIEDYDPSFLGMMRVIIISFLRVFSGGQYPSILVLEYGIDKPNDMDELLSVCIPDVAILTSIDSVHAANFPDGIQGIYNEKIKLLSATKDIICVCDAIEIDSSVSQGKTLITYSNNQDSEKSWFSDYKVLISGDHIRSSFIYIVGQNKIIVSSNVVGLHNIAYLALGLTIGDIVGHRKGYANIALEQAISLDVSLQHGRFSLFHAMNDTIIIDSTYNASPSSMKTVIQEGISLRDNFFPTYEIICVLGEMRELGDISIQEHKDLGIWLSDKVSIVIGVSGDSVYVTDYLIGLQDGTKHIYWVDKNIDVIPLLSEIINGGANKKYCIIMKSSQGEIYLEEAIKPFITKDERSQLPRQELFRLQKKRFLHKLYE